MMYRAELRTYNHWDSSTGDRKVPRQSFVPSFPFHLNPWRLPLSKPSQQASLAAHIGDHIPSFFYTLLLRPHLGNLVILSLFFFN